MTIRPAALAALVLLVAVPALAAGEQPRSGNPSLQVTLNLGLPRRCGICHLDRAGAPAAGLLTFRPPKSKGEAGGASMCFSCHNGIVDDRRRFLASGRHHPAAGKVSCGSCHTPHAWEANVGTFLRFPRGSFAYCATCHPGRGGRSPGEHPAVAQEKGQTRDCGGCHIVHEASGEGLLRVGSAEELCGPCHGDNPSRPGRGPGMATHVAGAEGPPCLGCHAVHRTAGGKALLKKTAHEGQLCRKCHERAFSKGRNGENHPVSAEVASCLSCHRMHNAEKQGARGGLLAVAREGVEEICRRCHAELVGAASGAEGWNHPVGRRISAEQRSLGLSLARSGASFAPGGKTTCLSCHRSHGGRAGTPQLVVAREALCLHCHQAQNSLDPANAAPGAHPVSVRPRRAKIAASFLSSGGVTGPGGEIICSTCHRAHRGRSGTHGLVLPREFYSCLLCHPDEGSVAATGHSTARVPGSTEGPGAAGICGGCHGEHGWRVPLKEPGAGETAIDRICLACHGGVAEGASPLATNHPIGVALPAGRGSGGLPLFSSEGRRYRQGLIACATCHDPHRTGPDGRFLREGAGGATGGQCLGCHRSQETVVGTRHDGTTAKGSTCGPCHPVHEPLAVTAWPTIRGGGERAVLEVDGFCDGCHREPFVAVPAVEKSHPAQTVAGKKAIGCLGCHNPHRWNPLDAADRGSHEAGDGRTSFLLRPAAGKAPLCEECHAEQILVAGTPHDLTERPGGGDFPDPLQHGICAVCHQVHGGGRAGAHPPSTGAGVVGTKPASAPDPCEQCHAAGGIAAGRTVGGRGHPVGIVAGQDYGPDLPLFGADGRRQPRGRIACATCHDPHRWEPPGGTGSGSRAASSFLRLGADGHAGLCFPCHADKSVVLGTDHDLRVTAPNAVNLAGEDAETSGVCGACHAVHHAPGGLALRNRGYGEGRDERSRLCAGCHRPGSAEGARVPQRAEAHLVNYPGRGLVSRLIKPTRTNIAGREGIVLFAEDGSWAEEGYFSCASCHDVHRWSRDGSSAGQGVPVEGDLENSFLRISPAALEWTLCADCHRGSLPEHYRNYHIPGGK